MKKNYILKLLSTFVLLILLSGCDAIAGLMGDETPPAPTATASITQTPTPAALGVDAPISLQLWVPPEFDPSGESEAAALLSARLTEYSQLHPGVRVVTRVKASDGPASMIESLSSAATAAPLALPDLVLVSTADARLAADRKLIYAIQQEVDFSEENDWFGFAGSLVTEDNEIWGFPFAADALVMVYRFNQTPDVPTTWAEFLQMGQRLIFPAADPQALFTLLMYLTELDQPVESLVEHTWDSAALIRVLNFYNQAQASNLMPYWLVQLDSDQEAWDAYLENQAEFAVTWISRYLQAAPENTSAAPIPTREGSTSTLTTGWVWSIATPSSDRQQAAEDLAAFLSEPEFTGKWTLAAGLLPVRPTGLEEWPSGPEQALANLILPAAVSVPDQSLMTRIGLHLQRATTAILKQEQSVNDAVNETIGALENSDG